MPTRSSNAGQVDRVLTGQRIGHQQVSCGLARCLDLGHLGHQGFVDDVRPAVSSMTTSWPPSLAASIARLAICTALLAFDDRQRGDPVCSPRLELLLRGRTARVERGHQDLLLVALQPAAWRSWPWWWSYPSPAGRPS
jgi:hypothetical protein